MKFIRYQKNKPEYRGIVDGEKIRRINGTIFHDYSVTDDYENISDVTILPPVLPSKIYGIRANYGSNKDLSAPSIFMKPPSTVIAHNENIVIPKGIKDVRIEGELAVIIGKKCRNVSQEHALQHILGYTIANDVTAPSSSADITVTIGKFYDTFLPLGQYIVTDLNTDNLTIKTYKNDSLVQEGSTKDMIFNISEQIAFLSTISTLLPGDVILTGTPSPSVSVKNGDKIEIQIESMGSLINYVVEQ